MSVQLDKRLRSTGTRFKLFPQPQYLTGFKEPETVYISVPPENIEAGPGDDRMFVIDAVNKRPYSELSRPPFTGSRNPPVQAGRDRHFDHLKPGSREFSCATMYATVRRVLDIWEDYFDHRIEWHFESDFSKLELIPLIEWDNAQSGYGFLEFGYGRTMRGGINYSRPYCENFDVLAHELGHSIVFSEVGIPGSPNDEAVDYGGMHESAGDLVAIVAALHFDLVTDHLLDHTKGNLFSTNELSRVGELSNSDEIRVAFNYDRMSDVGNEPHERSTPLTGGIFDILVEVFQRELVNRRLISQDLADLSNQGPGENANLQAIQQAFERAYKGKEKGFKEALLMARDYLGKLLARTWSNLSPDFLTYHTILRALLRADREINNGQYQSTIRECFAWREISLLPGSILLRPHTIDHCGLKLKHTILDEFAERLNNGDQSVRTAIRQMLADSDLKQQRETHRIHTKTSVRKLR